MKKRFIAKGKKKRKRYKIFLLFVLFILSVSFSFRALLKSNIKIDDKALVGLLLNDSGGYIQYDSDDKLLFKMAKVLLQFDLTDPASIIKSNYASLVKEEKVEKLNTSTPTKKNTDMKPLIYIYNTHQTEEYASSNFAEFSVNPTVFMADYILKSKFDEVGFPTIVEERSIKDLLNLNSWNYAASYKAARIYMESAKTEYPSLTYFIDVHRDSLTRDKTTIEIEGKGYAKTIFLIGKENPNYEQNLSFTTRLNDRLNASYPGLSKGIYEKGGNGVNGVYNQDFSPYTILIEIGGKENTVDEVLNSTLAFYEVFMEVISENEG